MVEEMVALHSSGTWDLVTLPAGKTLVGCRWVYKVKISLDGRVDPLKVVDCKGVHTGLWFRLL